MTKKDAAELVKAHFSKYKGMQTLHVTTDGQVFESENYAINHAKSLDKKNPVVITVKREDLVEAPADLTDEQKAAAEKQAAEKVAADKQKKLEALTKQKNGLEENLAKEAEGSPKAERIRLSLAEVLKNIEELSAE